MAHSSPLRTLLILAALVTMGGAARADTVTEPYLPITRINLQHSPFDACANSCPEAAAQERARFGPEPASPLYRTSATQAATTRGILIANLAARLGMTTMDADALVPGSDEAIKEWRDIDPTGDYRPNDLADVFAKYWLFSWMYGGGVTPDRVPAPLRTAVREQAHRLFATDPLLKLLTEGQRQGLADTLIRAQAADMLALMSAGGAEGLGPVMDTIVQQFKDTFAIDVRKLGLTPDQGFVLRVAPGADTTP